MRFLLIPALLFAQSSFTGSYPLLDGDVIRYLSTPPNDPAARLERRLERSEASLTFEEPYGYLLSVLRQLNIPLSSQTLVFSKTSSQQHLINPATPRAIYFNDSVYVGWVPGGDALEIAAVDPSQGTMFYTLDQKRLTTPKFVRRQECLQCHAGPATLGVPGLLMRSVFTAADGAPQLLRESFVTDHNSPLKERWGGWYVTGTPDTQHHMGHAIAPGFNAAAYPTPHSDAVALMLLAHQTHLHDLIARVNWETRLALSQDTSGLDSAPDRIHHAVEILLRYMLFTGEAPLEAPVQGTSTFAREFAAASPKDSAGRSLRALDLNRRMFRYPCSYLIYSEAFDALPKPALDYFYRRLLEVLTGKDQDPVFANLTNADRKAILSILRETEPQLPVK